MTPHLDITISGFVQGVSFRYYAAAKAKNLKLTGYVQNQPDGTVSIEAQGDPNALQDFLESLDCPLFFPPPSLAYFVFPLETAGGRPAPRRLPPGYFFPPADF